MTLSYNTSSYTLWFRRVEHDLCQAYLGQSLGVTGVARYQFHQPLEAVVNGGLCQCWGGERSVREFYM